MRLLSEEQIPCNDIVQTFVRQNNFLNICSIQSNRIEDFEKVILFGVCNKRCDMLYTHRLIYPSKSGTDKKNDHASKKKRKKAKNNNNQQTKQHQYITTTGKCVVKCKGYTLQISIL